MSSQQIHTPSTFRNKMQRLRTIYTQLERLQKEDIKPDVSIHGIVQDIKKVADDLLSRTAP